MEISVRVEARDLRLGAKVRLVEHRCLFQIRLSSVFDIATVLDPESILEISLNPHLSYNIAVLWHICARDEFDEEARGKCDSDRDNDGEPKVGRST